MLDENLRNVEEIIISPEKKNSNIKSVETRFITWNTIKYLNYYMIQLFQSSLQKDGLK